MSERDCRTCHWAANVCRRTATCTWHPGGLAIPSWFVDRATRYRERRAQVDIGSERECPAWRELLRPEPRGEE